MNFNPLDDLVLMTFSLGSLGGIVKVRGPLESPSQMTIANGTVACAIWNNLNHIEPLSVFGDRRDAISFPQSIHI
jgi:hypothetical protein